MSISRDTFDKLKHYVGVRLQQGVPLVDADWNEQEDIRRYELQAFLKWFVGNGVPEGNDGFRIISIVNKIILTSNKNDTGVSSIEVLDESSAASALGFGPGNNLASRAAPPSAQLTGDNAGPFVLADGMTLVISADDLPEETVTFHGSDFNDISAATAAEVVAAIDSAMSNLTASAGTINDFDIKGGDGTAEGAGRCLVEGWDVINESNLKYSAQPLFENETLGEKWDVKAVQALNNPREDRTDTVYLDVWEREVHADEDGNLVNSAIGLETCVRLKREWTVRVAERVKVDELPTPSDRHVYYPLAYLTRPRGKQAIESKDITDLRSTNVHLASAPSTTGVVVFPDSTGSVQKSDLIDPGLGPGAISVRLGLDYNSTKELIFVGHSQASAIFGFDQVLLGASIEPKSGMFKVGIKVSNLETLPIRVRWWAFKPEQDIGEVIIPSEIRVIIDPAEMVILNKGAKQQFSAEVTGTDNQAVTWRVMETDGGNVDDKGLYTAPYAAGSFQVRATSKADTSKYAEVNIRVQPVICVVGEPGAGLEPCTGSGPYLPCVVGQPS